MKLFGKYTRIILVVTISIFLVASLAFYVTLKYVQLQQIDADLEIEEEEIQLYIQKYKHLPRMMSVEDQLIHFTPASQPFRERYFTRSWLKDEQGNSEDFQQLIFGVEAEGKWYQVTVSKSLEETDHLITATFGITAVTILAILVSLLLINRLVLKRLWKPFFQTLNIVKDFKLDNSAPLSFPKTDTEEFSTMIQTLEESIGQARTDYLTLKTFSENAAHEIQTPIAIIRSKIDLLMQGEGITEHQSKTLQTVSKSIQRLSRLNTSLLLLAKIENRQYAQKETVLLKEKLEEKMESFQELWQMRAITVEADLHPAIVTMNKELVDILLNNLFSNATWHNRDGGKIIVRLRARTLEIGNLSNEAELDVQYVFQRFYKPSPAGDHNGLGLSIIKQISEASGVDIHYRYDEGLHVFEFSW